MKINPGSANATQVAVLAYSFVESVNLEELLPLKVLFPMVKFYQGGELRKVHPIGPGCKY